MAVPLASASSLSQFDRQLRQKPARFIRSMFWTSVRERRCSTRRRNTAASNSVLVLSSVVMAVISLFAQELDIKWDLSQILPYRGAKTASRALFEAAIKRCWSRCQRPVAREIIKELI